MVIGITDRLIITAVIDIIARAITTVAIGTTARVITTVAIGTTARVITTVAIVTTGTDPIDRGITGTATTVPAGITMVAIATGFAGDQASIGAQ
jgi:hypothetical protein